MARAQVEDRERRREGPGAAREPRAGERLRWSDESRSDAGYMGDYSPEVHLSMDVANYGASGDIMRGYDRGDRRRRDLYRSDLDSGGRWRLRAGRTGDAVRDREILAAQSGEAHRMWGGGYGGLQGGGRGEVQEGELGYLQGTSYGRGWGALHASDLLGTPDLRLDRARHRTHATAPVERARRSYAGVGPRGYRRSDVRIQEEVCERLTMHRAIDATDIDVRVEHGVVSLSGLVDDRRAKWLAEDVAEEVSGVTGVENRLRARWRGGGGRGPLPPR